MYTHTYLYLSLYIYIHIYINNDTQVNRSKYALSQRRGVELPSNAVHLWSLLKSLLNCPATATDHKLNGVFPVGLKDTFACPNPGTGC